MRRVVDFYRENPAVLVVALVVGGVVSVLVAVAGSDGVILPIAFTAFAGLLLGIVVASRRD